MVWRVIKETAVDTWDELLYVMVFNVIWLLGSLLIIPWPFLTFSLFFIAKDIGNGKGIKFGNFFRYGRDNLKSAYIWGGINLAVLIVLWLNFNFYASFEAQWARWVQIFFLGFIMFWGILQLVVLGLYPRLVKPSFKLAHMNAAVIMARHPLIILGLVATIILIMAISWFLPAIAFLLPFTFIAILTNNMIEVLVSQELERQEEAED